MTLSSRIEALTGPDRAVDAEVLGALGTRVLEKRGRDRKAWWYRVGGSDFDRLDPDGWAYLPTSMPRFTASLDAAMSVVPEGHFWSITMRGVKRGGFDACCQREGLSLRWVSAPTPALALLAAAMQARGL